MSRRGELGSAIRRSLSRALESILGASGLYALRFHVERRLGMDMYDAFCEDPCGFYRAVEGVLGGGAEALMRRTLLWLVQSGRLSAGEHEVDSLLRLLREGGEEARNTIISLFRRGLGEGC